MWTYRNTFGIGGLENVGFAPGQDYLLVLSSQGEGIFDCIKGKRIARLRNNLDWWQRFDQTACSITGFGLLSGLSILTGGLSGKDILPKITKDGWILETSDPFPDDPPFERYLVSRIYLLSPDKKEKILVAKDGPCERRSFGFSATGNSFVVAFSCELVIYSRTKPLDK